MNIHLHRAISDITSTTLKNEGLESNFNSSPKYVALGNAQSIKLFNWVQSHPGLVFQTLQGKPLVYHQGNYHFV